MPESLGPLIDDPGWFASLDTWERFLGQLRTLEPSAMRDAAVARAEHIIKAKRGGGRLPRNSSLEAVGCTFI